MESGQILKLIPFRRDLSKGKGFSTKADRETYDSIFTEKVIFVKIGPSGNATIIDKERNIRLCNPDDLTAVFD